MDHDPSNNVPHYLRTARALALIAGVALAGCSATVGPNDGSTSDVPLATDTALVTDAAPTGCESPGPVGAPCVGQVQCGAGCEAWACNAPDGGTAMWYQLLCGGPLPPPELSA